MTDGRDKMGPATREDLRRALDLLKSGKLQAADDLSREILSRDETNPTALNYRGVIAGQRGDFGSALRLLTKSVESDPGSVEALVNLGTAQMALKQPEQAIRSLTRAAGLETGNAAIRYALGSAQIKAGEYVAAIVSFDEALALKPDLVDAHISKGAALLELMKLDQAEACFRTALSVQPNAVGALNNLGVTLNRLERSDEALEVYEAVLKLQPNHRDAAYNKLSLLQRMYRLQEPRECLPHANRSLGNHPGRQLVEARLLQQERQFETALALLDARDPPPQLAPAWANEQGKLCDSLGEVDSAFDHFVRANRLSAETLDKAAVSPERETALLRRLQEFFSSPDFRPWRPEGLKESRPNVAFVVGFPRSGTTLLDQALRGAAGVEVMSEVPALDAVKLRLDRHPHDGNAKGFPDTLADLDSDSIAELRRTYFEEAWRKVARREDALLLDRMALNIRQIGLIHRLFPEARIVNVLRHPCDAVLSAFMQHFRHSDILAHFLDLRESALYYARVMQLWDLYRQALPLQVHEVRYEDLVADFRGEMTGLLGFLGLDWDDRIGEFDRRSRDVGRINTPSYRQVTQPLYQSARYRWEKYRGHMAEILPILEPYIRRYGYDTNEDA